MELLLFQKNDICIQFLLFYPVILVLGIVFMRVLLRIVFVGVCEGDFFENNLFSKKSPSGLIIFIITLFIVVFTGDKDFLSGCLIVHCLIM